jgi:catechol 2,3-dioxygenase-like lactoylglutathione lyase family enzyme
VLHLPERSQKAYVVPMTSALRSMVAATYVRDIGASRTFYELLGFREFYAGKAATSAWSSLRHNEHRILLASTLPPLDIPRLPLLFYFFFDDLGSIVRALETSGVTAVAVGHPPHALGGEVKVLDPDGNTVLLGQRERSASQPPRADDEGSPQFSLLKEAAALVQARGGTTAACQVKDLEGALCQKMAEVKLADSRGDTVWACLGHADEILVTVPAAFLVSQEDQGPGIAEFLRARHG